MDRDLPAALVIRPVQSGTTFAAAVIRIDLKLGAQQLVARSSQLHDPLAVAVTADGDILAAAVGGLFLVHVGLGAPTRVTPETVNSIAVVPTLPD